MIAVNSLAVVGSVLLDTEPGPVVLCDSLLWFVGDNGTLYAYTNANTPVFSASYDINATPDIIAVDDDYVIVASGSALVAYDSSGEEVSRLPSLCPAVRAIAGDGAGTLYVLDGMGRCFVVTIDAGGGLSYSYQFQIPHCVRVINAFVDDGNLVVTSRERASVFVVDTDTLDIERETYAPDVLYGAMNSDPYIPLTVGDRSEDLHTDEWFPAKCGATVSATVSVIGFANSRVSIVNTSATAPDQTAPIISSVDAVVVDDTATVTWTTDVATDGQVEYGLTAAYGSASSLEASATSHSRTLTGLTAGETYHYRVVSRDAAGNPAVSADATFFVLPTEIAYPTISGGSIIDLVVDGTTAWIVGSFTTVGGLARQGAAAFNTTTGEVLPFTVTFLQNAHVNSSFSGAYAVAYRAGVVYIGGYWQSYDAGSAAYTDRSFVAVNSTTGARLNGTIKVGEDGIGFDVGTGVEDILTDEINSQIILIGSFINVGAVTRGYAASLSFAYALNSWDPVANSRLNAGCVADGFVYLAGATLVDLNGTTVFYVGRVDAVTAVADAGWQPTPGAAVKAVAVDDDGDVYTAGTTVVLKFAGTDATQLWYGADDNTDPVTATDAQIVGDYLWLVGGANGYTNVLFRVALVDGVMDSGFWVGDADSAVTGVAGPDDYDRYVLSGSFVEDPDVTARAVLCVESDGTVIPPEAP